MILDKPSWIRHGDANKPDSIYSIDAHSDGTRLATAGGDGKVIIWSVKYINSHFKKGAAHAKGGNGIGNGKGKSGASRSSMDPFHARNAARVDRSIRGPHPATTSRSASTTLPSH